MIPLNMADINEENVIKRVGGKTEVKKHLEDIGFVVGGTVTLISKIGDNVIVNVKGTRIAISSEMARKIYV